MPQPSITNTSLNISLKSRRGEWVDVEELYEMQILIYVFLCKIQQVKGSIQQIKRIYWHCLMGANNILINTDIFNASPPGENAISQEDIFTCIFVNEKFCILVEI